MTRQAFIDLLKRKGYTYKVANGGVSVTHHGPVFLDSLNSIPESTKFENHGPVFLGSLTNLPEGTKFENHGPVFLDSLNSIPESTKFENHGPVLLDSLTGQHIYRGKLCKFRIIDGYTMLLMTSKSYGGYTVHAARYFGGGPLSDLRKCYVAEGNGFYAHGATIKEAVKDLKYKVNANADKKALAKEVAASGRVTLAQFRGITGACREGVRQHLSNLGIDLSTIDDMPLSDALKAMSGTSYGNNFKAMVEAQQ